MSCWRDGGSLRATLGTEFVVTGEETVLIGRPNGSEAEVPLLDLREFVVHMDRPLVGDNPYGLSFDELHHEIARMTRQIETERRRAPRQLAALLAGRREEREAAVAALAEPTFSLAAMALERSRELVHSDPVRAGELAGIGKSVAERLPDDLYGVGRVADLRAYAWAVHGNALRVGGDLRKAAEAFGEARRWLDRGNGTSLEAVQVAELETSFLRDARDYEGALARSAEAIAAHEERGRMEDLVRVMVKQASIYELMNQPERAIEVLERVEYLGASIDDQWLRLCSRHSLIFALARAERIDEAAQLLQRSWGLYEQFAKPAVVARRHWAQGLICLGRGAAAEAAEHLREARAVFTRYGYLADTALVTLELAVALAERFKWDEVAALAAETLALLEGRPVHQETLAAVKMLEEAGARRRLDRALGRELLRRVVAVAEQRPTVRGAPSGEPWREKAELMRGPGGTVGQGGGGIAAGSGARSRPPSS